MNTAHGTVPRGRRPVERVMRVGAEASRDWWRGHPVLSAALVLAAVDAVLTLPWIFSGPADGDTLRYALSYHRWTTGLTPLARAFNAEMSPGYYILARVIAVVTATGLSDLPRMLNVLSWGGGVVATGFLYAWWRRWFGAGVAVRLVALFILTPAFWTLHLYGNPNIVGLAFAAAAAMATTSLPAPTILDHTGSNGRRRGFLVLTGMLAFVALVIRADTIMLLPAIVLGAHQTAGRRSAVRALLIWLGAAALYLILRVFVLGQPGSTGTVGRHLSSNLDLRSTHWLLFNTGCLATAAPPLVLLASLLAMIGMRGLERRRVRTAAIVWLAAALPFLLFARVHVTRILIPLIPAMLLPLAYWMARGSLRRTVSAGALVLAGHLAMLGGPALLDRMELRQAEPRRPGHWFFLGNALDDHIFLADQVRRGLQDAREAVRESVTTTDPPTVVVGQESIFQEFAFQEAYPRARTSVLARGYMIRLLEVRDDDGRLLGYLMDKGQPGPPLAILESLGFTFGHPVRIRRTGPQVDRGP